MLQRCFDNNFNEIQIGVDEAGRGSLAGPVFAGAVIFDPNFIENPLKGWEMMLELKINF